MTINLRQKTLSGLIWSFIDSVAGQGITFVVGVILARMLSPREFGLIGMILVFVAVSESFINSGFGSALIRKNDCTQADYSTVFFFNMIAGIIFFLLLFFSAPIISHFYQEPELKSIIRVVGIGLIIESLTIIQRTIIIKNINFKLQARISIIASSVSGCIAIIMAFKGFGVWSLVAQRLIKQLLNTAMLWLKNSWKPDLIFNAQSFSNLFGFGGKLLISGLIETVYQNIYYLIIGKFFSAQDLGFYTRADEFKRLPSQNLLGIIDRVSYPVLSCIQKDVTRLKYSYQMLIRCTMFISFILMLGMAAVAEPMVLTFIGEKWRTTIIYLQMLSFVGMMYPLHALNLNMLMVQGRSDLFLRLEIIKKILALPTILIGIMYGIKIMIVGMIINTMISYCLNSYWSGRMINYSFKDQVRDIFPSFVFALSIAIVVFFLGVLLPLVPLYKLIIQTVTGLLLAYIFAEIFKLRDYSTIKELFLNKLRTF